MNTKICFLIGSLFSQNSYAKKNNEIYSDSQKCKIGLIGIETRMIGVEGLVQYAKSSPRGSSEIDDAVEGLDRLPFPVLSTEYRHCLKKNEKIALSAKLNIVSTKPVQYFLDGTEQFIQRELNFKSYFGVAWGAKASYINPQIGIGYKVHPFVTLTSQIGYSRISAAADLAVDELILQEEYSGLRKKINSVDDLGLIELRENGDGFTFDAAVAIRNERRLEVSFGLSLQKMRMTRKLYVPKKTKDELNNIQSTADDVEERTTVSLGISEAQTSWAHQEDIIMNGWSMGMRWWF
ncbi:hypothetical protein HOA92_00750 [archaeon]|nr:hypothetical protein [archaeon]MBT6761546.1 hypothetical protein [archaeon]